MKLAKVETVAHPQRGKAADGRQYLQTPEQLETYKQFSMCINCLLCYAACPVYGLDPLFSGPGGASRWRSATTWTRATRGPSERLDILSQHDGIWGCTFVGECTEVCPKHVDPAGAIQQYKLTGHAGMDQVVPDAMRGGK